MNNPVQSVSLNVGHIGKPWANRPWNDCLCLGEGNIFLHGTPAEFRAFIADLTEVVEELAPKEEAA